MSTHFAVRRTPSLRNATGRRPSGFVNLPTVGQCFEVEVTRAFDGWLIRIPEIDGVAHAIRRSSIEIVARETIATRTGIPMGYVAVVVTGEVG